MSTKVDARAFFIKKIDVLIPDLQRARIELLEGDDPVDVIECRVSDLELMLSYVYAQNDAERDEILKHRTVLDQEIEDQLKRADQWVQFDAARKKRLDALKEAA